MVFGATILGSTSSAYDSMPSRSSRSAMAARFPLPSSVSAWGKVAARRIPRTRAGNARANSITIWPPIESPPITTPPTPRWSSSAAMSSAN